MKKKNLIVAGSIIVVLLGFAGCSNDSVNTNTSAQTTNSGANSNKTTEAPKADTTKTVNTTKKESTNYGGINPNIVEHKEMNGSNTAQIGNYATTTYDAATTTDADIIRFYNDKIKGSKNGYVTLIDGTNSIEFCGSNADTIIKGPIENDNRSVVKPVYYGQIDGNTIKWTKPDKDTV